ncbi:MAG: phosphotransferase enzyme family protein [Sulfuricaulis sp.]
MTPEHTVAEAFNLGDRIQDIRPYGHGLINDTFVITTTTGRHVILQRINHRVFPEPVRIMENLRTLGIHIRRRQDEANFGARDLRLPEIFSARDGKDYVTDAQGALWRALGFIENTHTLAAFTNPGQAEEAGYALGRFHALTHDLAPARLHETLPGFHNAPAYFARFLRACARPRRVSSDTALLHCLSFVEVRSGLTRALETARHAGRLRLRPIHGDPKLDNFLFDAKSERVVSLIDLDTVQPGLIQHDIGDCLRSCCNPAGESPADIASVRFDLDICRAILGRYLSETRDFLTPDDYHYIYVAIRLIPFELGMRFLTDHLENDLYFKTDWPGQNLFRARVQFALTAAIEREEERIRSLIAELSQE